MTTYRIVLIAEADGGYSVLVPSLPGCFTQGDTKEQAIAMAKEAIELHLESMREHGEPIPNSDIEIVDVQVEVPAA